MKKIIIKVLLAILFVSVLVIIYYCIFKNKTIEQIKDSVVKIEIYDDNNELLSTGSGFCMFKKNYILTNYHVIEGARFIKIIDDNNKSYSVNKIEIFNSGRDLAIVSGDFSFEPIKMSKRIQHAGDEIICIGSPKGLLNTVSTGVISNADDDYQIRITAPISPGSSGGVLLDKDKKCIGMTYAGMNMLDAQNINYAIDKKYILEMYEYLSNNKAFILKDKDISNINLDIENPTLNENFLNKYDIYRYMESMESFYRYTSYNKMFENTLKEKDIKWYEIYATFSSEEKYKLITIFKNFNLIEENNSLNIPRGFYYINDMIKNYTMNKILYDFVISKYQYIMILVKLNTMFNVEEKIEFIDKLPLENAQKLIVRYTFIDKDINYFTIDEKKEMYDWIYKKYHTNYYIEILKFMGYEYDYKNNKYRFYFD